MENKIFAVDTCNESIKEVLGRSLDGIEYDDTNGTVSYKGVDYDVYQCEVLGITIKDLRFYRLIAFKEFLVNLNL